MSNAERSPSLAVLIDADNTSARYAKVIFDEIAAKFGEANVRRIYGDFSGTRLGGWDKAIQSLAILQHQQRNNTTGKNAADIALVIDAMDLLHKGKLDGFCLISSDSDFTRLAQRLREDDLKVYGFGERKTPEAFRSACNQFIYVDNLIEVGVEATIPKKAGGAAESVSTSKAASGPKAKRKADPKIQKGTDPESKKEPAYRAVPTILKAMVGIEDDDGWAHLSRIGSQIAIIAPDFDPRSYGHAKLGDLIEASGGFDVKSGTGTARLIRPRRVTIPE